jgi:hypothetical protein
MKEAYSKIQSAAVYDLRLSDGALRVLCALGVYADSAGRCFPSMGTLAARLSLDVRSVRRHLRALEVAGYIETEQRMRVNGQGGNAPNEYRLIFKHRLGAVSSEQADTGVRPQADNPVRVGRTELSGRERTIDDRRADNSRQAGGQFATPAPYIEQPQSKHTQSYQRAGAQGGFEWSGDSHWEARLLGYKSRRFWLDEWGDKPDQPKGDMLVPKALLIRHGYRKAS